MTWCIRCVWFFFLPYGNLPCRVMVYSIQPPWLCKHLWEVGRYATGAHIMYPQARLRTQSWIRPGQFFLSRILRSIISSFDRWENATKRDGDFLQVIQPELGRAGPVNILWLPFQINCAAGTSYWSIKTENDWQAWVHDSLHRFMFKQCFTVKSLHMRF